MKVKTKEPVQYDGKAVKPGSVIDVTDAAGEQLIEVGAAELVGKTKRDPEPVSQAGQGIESNKGPEADKQTESEKAE